jgi:PAS domain S-box-containing protein
MRSSGENSQKPIEQTGKPRSRKAKLEPVSHDIAESIKTPSGLKDLARSLMENVHIAISLIDRNHKILMVNNALSKYFCKPAFEFIGRDCFREFEKRESVCSHCPGKRAMETGQPAEVETEGIRDDGSRFSVRIQAFPTIGLDGAVTGFIEIVEDITGRKRVENLMCAERNLALELSSTSNLDEALQLSLEVAINTSGMDCGGICLFNEATDNFELVYSKGLSKDFVESERVFHRNSPPGKILLKGLPVYSHHQILPKRDTEYKENLKAVAIVPIQRYNKVLASLNVASHTFNEVPVWSQNVLEVISAQIGGTVARLKTEDALRKSEQKYKDIFENAREAIVTVDLDGRITEVNKLVEEYGFKKEELIGKKLFDFIPEYDKARSVSDFEILVGGNPVNGEMDVITPKGIFTVEYRDNPIVRAGEVIGVQIILTDITERKRAEQLLRKERDKAQKYLDVAAVIMVAIDTEQRVGLINKKGCEILGYSEDEILGKNWFNNFLPKSIKDEVKEIFDKVLSKQANGPEYHENLVLTKNGEERLIAWHNTVLRDDKGEVIATLSSGEDITERKQAEGKLLEDRVKLKSLASQLTLAEERERRRIAAELHDKISQSIVISKMKLDRLRNNFGSDDSAKVMEEVCILLGEVIVDIRSLTFELSSPILHELGLEAAVAAWLAEEIEQKHGIAVEFEEDKEPKPLDDETKALLFRNVRELLINVVKHSRATKVKVSIRRVGNQINIGIEDNGIGFIPADVTAKAVRNGGFGLFSIQERLEELGGCLEIMSEPGHGCRVVMTTPLKCSEEMGDKHEYTNLIG